MSTSGSDGGGIAPESVSLNFSKMTVPIPSRTPTARQAQPPPSGTASRSIIPGKSSPPAKVQRAGSAAARAAVAWRDERWATRRTIASRRPDEAFRAAHQERDAKVPVDIRDSGERVIAARRVSARTPISESELRKLVNTDLLALLNTTNLDSAEDLSDAPEVRKSILNFGFPDLASRSIDESAVSDISRQIEATLATSSRGWRRARSRRGATIAWPPTNCACGSWSAPSCGSNPWMSPSSSSRRWSSNSGKVRIDRL